MWEEVSFFSRIQQFNLNIVMLSTLTSSRMVKYYLNYYDRTRDNGHKMKYKTFHLNIRIYFFIKCKGDWRLKQVVHQGYSELRLDRTCLDLALSREHWLNDLQRFLLTSTTQWLYNSMKFEEIICVSWWNEATWGCLIFSVWASMW